MEESEFDEIDGECEEEEEEEETILERATSNPFLILGECWKGLSPPISETEIVGKWYACIFKAKKKTYLYIGRATRRFLNDEGGLITALEIDCLEQKLGVTDNVLKQGQQDIGIFAARDVICGPLQMFPLQHAVDGNAQNIMKFVRSLKKSKRMIGNSYIIILFARC